MPPQPVGQKRRESPGGQGRLCACGRTHRHGMGERYAAGGKGARISVIECIVQSDVMGWLAAGTSGWPAQLSGTLLSGTC